jgi:hypothetical protein
MGTAAFRWSPAVPIRRLYRLMPTILELGKRMTATAKNTEKKSLEMRKNCGRSPMTYSAYLPEDNSIEVDDTSSFTGSIDQNENE